MSEILLRRDNEVSWVALLLRDLEHNIHWFITQWVQRAAISSHANTLPRTEDLLEEFFTGQGGAATLSVRALEYDMREYSRIFCQNKNTCKICVAYALIFEGKFLFI